MVAGASACTSRGHRCWSKASRGEQLSKKKKKPQEIKPPRFQLIDLFNPLVRLCRVEGRTWYTSHRGRLWIAAAAKKPTPQEIAEVEAIYRHIYRRGKCAVHGGVASKAGATQTLALSQAGHVSGLCVLLCSGIYPDFRGQLWCSNLKVIYCSVCSLTFSYSNFFFRAQISERLPHRLSAGMCECD